MSLLEKLKKNTTIKDTAILAKSKFFAAKDMIQTSIPVVNVAFSGDLDGGFTPGLTMWAGPSKHFKTAFSLLMAKAYQDKYPDSVVLGKSVADMSRAKQIKSLFRMVTPHLTLKDIPMVVVNHTYKEIGLYPKDIVGGGTGSYYSADNIYILGRQQEKEGTDLIGYNFIINVEKSRYVREKAKIPVTVRFDGGISKYSGLLDMALESGHVTKPNVGWYAKVNTATGEVDSKKWRLADTECAEFWDPILADEKFKEWVCSNYQFSAAVAGNLIDEVVDDGHE